MIGQSQFHQGSRREVVFLLLPKGIYCLLVVMDRLLIGEQQSRPIPRLQKVMHGTFILPWLGMSLRDRQRAYYYDQLDRLFPGLRARYERTYGERYSCPVPNADELRAVFAAACERYGIATDVKRYEPETPEQLSLF